MINVTFDESIKEENRGKIQRNLEYWCDGFGINANLNVQLKSVLDTDITMEMGIFCRNNVFGFVIDDEVSEYKENSVLLNSYYCHECVHIKDMQGIIESGNEHIINSINCIKEDDYYAHMGFLFWTEYLAHKRTCEIFKEYGVNFEETFLDLIKRFHSWNTKNYDLAVNDKVNEENANERVNDIQRILYNLSHHMASVHSGKRRIYNYNEELKSQQVFRWLYRRVCTLENLLYKMDYATYSKYTYSRLRNIGKYLYKFFYLPFGMELYKQEDGSITFVVY